VLRQLVDLPEATSAEPLRIRDPAKFDTLLRQADRVCRFPAKMSPRLARWFLSTAIDSNRLQTFHDPLCGSGTTTLVARAFGLPVSASDISYAATIITKAKITRLGDSKIREMKNFPTSIDLSFSSQPRAKWEHWQIWYKGRVLRALEEIRDAIFDSAKEPFFPHLLTCLFQTSWEVSSADKGVIVPTRSSFSKRARNISPKSVLALFRARLDRIELAQSALAQLSVPMTRCRVIRGSALREYSWPRDSVDICLTSPPYGCGVDYERAFRLQMKLCEVVPEVSKESIIGRHSRLSSDLELPSYLRKHWVSKLYKAKDIRVKMFLQYLSDMSEFMNKCSSHMNDNGKLCIIIGNPQIAKRRISLVEILVKIAKENGFRLQAKPKADRIPSRIQNFAPRSATGFIRAEFLLTFKLKT